MAVEPNGIPVEVRKVLGNIGIECLTGFFNKVLKLLYWKE